MAYSDVRELMIENRHSGERLAMRRVKRGDEVWLELKGSLPPHRQGPPLHIHGAEDEDGVVRSGTLSAVLNGRRFTAGSVPSRIEPPVVERRGRTPGVRRLCAARSGPGPISSSDLRSPQCWLGRPTSALLHGPSPATASSHADRTDHAAADSSRAVSSDRHGGHPAWALSRGRLARVSISLCWCAGRCRRTHVTDDSETPMTGGWMARDYSRTSLSTS